MNSTVNMSIFRLSDLQGCSTPIRHYNHEAEMSPVEISDDSSDEDMLQIHFSADLHAADVHVADVHVSADKSVKSNGNGKIRNLKVILNRMSPGYIRDMLNGVVNGVKPTQPARNLITQPEVRQTNADQHNKSDGQRDASEIDFKSWQWQPNIKLDRITVNHSENSDEDVPPIEFDSSEESFIRELSPEKATKMFEKRMEVIRQSIQPISMQPKVANPKRKRIPKRVNESQIQYEETHKRLQESTKKRPKNAKRGRRLYNPNDSSEDLDEKENDEPEAKRDRMTTEKPIRILPKRAAKNLTTNSVQSTEK